MAKQQHRRNLDADPYIIQARCEMAAYVYLRPITWRLELVDDLSTFSDFIAVRTDLDVTGDCPNSGESPGALSKAHPGRFDGFPNDFDKKGGA